MAMVMYQRRRSWSMMKMRGSCEKYQINKFAIWVSARKKGLNPMFSSINLKLTCKFTEKKNQKSCSIARKRGWGVRSTLWLQSTLNCPQTLRCAIPMWQTNMRCISLRHEFMTGTKSKYTSTFDFLILFWLWNIFQQSTALAFAVNRNFRDHLYGKASHPPDERYPFI